MSQFYSPFQSTISPVGLNKYGLSLQSAIPCAVLKPFVHSYLQISATRATSYAILPDGSQAIYISPNGIFISGAQLELRQVQILRSGEYFGIRFYPGALRAFFKLDLADITGQFVDAHYFPCPEFRYLHETIFTEKVFYERASLCEQWLLKHFLCPNTTPFDLSLNLLYQCFGNEKISDLAEQVGFSTRHINRLFHQHTGLNTKSFAKVIRLQHLCKALCLSSGKPIDILKQDFGFYDQSHLINELKQYLGYTPIDLFKAMSDFSN